MRHAALSRRQPRLGGNFALLLGYLCACLASFPSAASAQLVEYYHTDLAGNVRVVTDETKHVVERHDYLPFGEECTVGACASNPEVGVGQARKFTGKERDTETGFDYFGARYYGSRIGRFTTTDPVVSQKDAVLNPQKWNRYAYGRNNPLRYVDPDGRDDRGVIELEHQQALARLGPASTQLTPEQQRVEAIFRGWVFEPLLLLTGMAVGEMSPGMMPPAGTGVRANNARGNAWSQAVGADLKATHEVAVPEITVRTQSGARTRLDWVTKDSGTIGCVECKASATAPLTPGQTAAHPEIAQTGATVVGKGKPGIPGGTVISPTEVQVRRPQ
jgi:RHS repeat-associated protein